MQYDVGRIRLWAATSRRHSKRLVTFVALLSLVASILMLDQSSNIITAAPTAPQPPTWTTSYYINTTNATVLYNLGRAQGQRSVSEGPGFGAVILDFGQPIRQNGVYGVNLFGAGFTTGSQVVQAVRNFAGGFWGNTPYNGPKIRILVGTNNYEGADGSGEITSAHGAFWAQTVAQAAQVIRDAGFSSQITVSGANDMEMNWSTPDDARQWLSGWRGAAQNALYDFGDAAGCFAQGRNKQGVYLCNRSDFPPYGRNWNVEDVWYKVKGVGFAFPIPQIYPSCCQAERWARISLEVGVQNHGEKIVFAGALTNWCDLYPNCPPYGNPNTNTPAQGWAKLYDALNADVRTSQDLGWITDIKHR